MRKLTSLRVATAIALAALAAAPLAAIVRGPDAGGYTATDETVSSFVDVSGAGGAAVLAGTDDGVAALTLPFPFAFYGQTYSLVCVSSNGALYFITAAASCSGVNDIGNVDLALTTPNDWPALFPFWSDLTFQAPGAGAVFYQTAGTPGNRRFVVQWNNVLPIESASPVTFQIVLSEGTNAILFQYKTVFLGAGNPASGGADATVGVRNTAGGANNQRIQWSFNAPVLTDGSALLFTKSLVPTLAVLDTAVTYNGSPQAVTATATGINNETLGPVTVTYNGSATAPTNAGTYAVVASYAGNGTYTAATASATLTIDRATPVITWPTPAGIVAGTPLGATQLNANANVAGSFVYIPPAGTVLPDGAGQTLNATFTPADGANYTTATASVLITVTPATGQAGRFIGAAGLDTSSAQTRFAFEVRTHPPNERGAIVLRTRPNQPRGRNADDDRDDRHGPWKRFVSTHVTSATATNTPGVNPGPRPPGGVDTLVFAGVGRWNGTPNYRFTATAIDAGEPGPGRDRFAITVMAPNGTVVLNMSGTITIGNIQSLWTR